MKPNFYWRNLNIIDYLISEFIWEYTKENNTTTSLFLSICACVCVRVWSTEMSEG